MSASLQKRIHGLVRQTLDLYPSAWLVWCDPRGEWAPLLRRVAGDSRMGGFALLEIEETTAGQAGSPLARSRLQERLDGEEPLVLLIRAGDRALGWLWAQALLAEKVYACSLREQLVQWGWQTHDPTMSEAALAALALQKIAQDPADWSTNGLTPDPALLLRVLASLEAPDDERRPVLDRTIEQHGLPPLDEADLAGWRRKALAALLVTQAQRALPGVLREGHALLVESAKRADALALLAAWLDSVHMGKALPTLIAAADPLAGLGPLVRAALADPARLDGLLAAAGGSGALETGGALSRAAEAAVYAAVCARFAGSQGTALLDGLAAARAFLDARAAGPWGTHGVGTPPLGWGDLARLAGAAGEVIAATPSSPWANPMQAIAWYTSTGWRLDRAGEEVLRGPDAPAAELTAVVVPLREAYRSRWEDLAIRWSETWRAAGYPDAGLPTAGEWLKGALATAGPTAVIVADACRYDLARALAARLNEQEGAPRARVSAARAPLPSVTALGMGQALPISAADLEARVVNGAWQLRERGRELNLSLAADRRQWWETAGQVPAAAIGGLKALLDGDVPASGGTKARLVAYDDAIDKLGHDDELEAQGAQAILDRYLAVIGRLRDAGWRRVLLTTDHGYIHWSGTLEQAAPPPAPNPAYSSRRAMAYPAGALPGPYPLAPGGAYQVAVPSGAATFRAYGGRGYYHGGGSLQEWVLPCFTAEWPSGAKPVEAAPRPVKAILSLAQKLMVDVQRPADLFNQDALPRQVAIVVRNTLTHEILFRAAPRTITPGQDTVEMQLQATEAAAPRGTPVTIELLDLKDDAPIATTESILQVEKDAWS